MDLPFTSAQFFDVFGAYNRSLWVFVLGLWMYAAVGVFVLARSRDGRGRFLPTLLVVQWAWAGLAYHAAFFSRINPAAWLFAALFVVQSLLFFWFGVVHHQLRFAPRGSFRHAAAWTLIIYALVYPLIVRIEGHVWDAPTFGVPCPTTLLTIGFLFAADLPWPRTIAVIPVLWSFVAGSAAILLGVRADLMLWVAGVALGAYVLRRSDGHRQVVSRFRSDDRASRSDGLVAR